INAGSFRACGDNGYEVVATAGEHAGDAGGDTSTSSTKTDKVWRVTSCGAGISLRSPLRFREWSPVLQQLIHFHQTVGAGQRRTGFLHSKRHRKSLATPERLRQR